MKLNGYSNECVAAGIFSLYYNTYLNKYIDERIIAENFNCDYEKMQSFIAKIKKKFANEEMIKKLFQKSLKTNDIYLERLNIIVRNLYGKDLDKEYNYTLQKFARYYIQKFIEKNIKSINPMGVVAAIIYRFFIYFAKKHNIKAYSQERIATECHVSLNTLRARLKDVKKI